MEKELPVLIGFPKQVKWAEQIRERAIQMEPGNARLRLICNANTFIQERYKWDFK